MRRRIKKYPKLTKEQQELVKNHSWVSGRLAQQAKSLTGGHTGSLAKEDLESIANFALCVAATRFNPDCGVMFSTYAWRTARGYIQHALRDYSRMVRTPRWIAPHRKAVEEKLNEKKTYSEIALELGIPEDKVLEVELSANNYHVSYDGSPDEDGFKREFVFEEDEAKSYVLSNSLKEALVNLTNSEILLLSKFVEGQEIPKKQRDWAVQTFDELRDLAYGG